MTTPKSLPARPSEESLRKRARQLSRERGLSHREGQLVLAREYGFAGWQDLIAEVARRLGKGLDWAGEEARQAIHDNNLERLKQLVAEHPALLSWGLEHGGLVGRAVQSYAMDVSDPERERMFTRRECAELLIDAGAQVVPWLVDGMLDCRSNGMLRLFERKGLLPRTLKIAVALGDEVDVRTRLDEISDIGIVNDAFATACLFRHEAIASRVLERAIQLSPELGKQIDGWGSRATFVEFMCKNGAPVVGEWSVATGASPWRAFLMRWLMYIIDTGDLQELTRVLRTEPWLIGGSNEEFEVGMIGHAVFADRAQVIEAILDLDPGLIQRRPPSHALAWAFTSDRRHLVPLLTRIWPLPDDLPHAAGNGDFESVKKWFDASGAPALGDPANHYPGNKPRERGELHWSPPTDQRVLDTALGWAMLNRHFGIADFLIRHGADVNTRWATHEPASIMHELVFREDYEAMQFLIDRGFDLTIVDYRWGGTAQGWAYHAANNPKLAQWLADAGQRRKDSSGN